MRLPIGNDNNDILLTNVFLAVAAAVTMGTIGVFSRITELPAEVITFYRLGLGAAFLWLFLKLTKSRHPLSRPSGLLIFSGILLAAFILFYVQAMNYTTMANAILMVYLAPIVASVFAFFFYKEHLSLVHVFFIATALLGFAMVLEFQLNVSGNPDTLLGLGLASLAMFAYAGFILVNRRLPDPGNGANAALWQLAAGAAAIAPFALSSDSGIVVAQQHWGWLLATGFIPGFIAIYFAVLAISRLPTSVYGTLAYSEPVAVVIFGWTLFDETLNLLQASGCIIILISGMAQAQYSRRSASLQH